MRSLLAFVLLALTGLRAENAGRIFIDGKGVQKLAFTTGSSATPTKFNQEHLVPKSLGRLTDVVLPSKYRTKLINEDSANPKIVSFDGLQTLMDSRSTELGATPEPEDTFWPEPSSETEVSIVSAPAPMLVSLPSSERTPVPELAVEPVHSSEASPFAEFANSLSSSSGNHHNIGPITSVEDEIGGETLEALEAPEATLAPFEVDDALKPTQEDIWASNEAEISGEPEMSGEPEASTDELPPSTEMKVLEVDLIVRHPDSLDPTFVAEEIRLISDEITGPLQWNETGLFLLPSLSKYGYDISVADQADEVSNFELNLQLTCLDPSGCESQINMYKDFIRDGHMDETLAAHDMARVNVFLKDDLIDRSTMPTMDATAPMNGGVIAAIGAIGAVACISLLLIGILFMAKRRHGGNDHHDAEQGKIESSSGGSDEEHQSHNPGEEEGSFMISNFGGTPRNTEALNNQWMSNSNEGSFGQEGERSGSFITVDTAGTAEIATTNLSNYRFEEMSTSTSGSDTAIDCGDNDVDNLSLSSR